MFNDIIIINCVSEAYTKDCETSSVESSAKIVSTAPKVKSPIKDFFRKCDQIYSFLRIMLQLLKKSLMENLVFGAVQPQKAVSYFREKLQLNYLHLRRLFMFQDHQKFCQMKIEQCDCGERFSLSEVSTEVLNHWKHQTKCIFSYIGCVSYALCLFLSFLNLMESRG